MGEKSHSAQNSLIGLLTGRIVSDSEIMTQVLVNDKIGKVDFGERNLTDYLANQEVTASSGELQMREAMPSQAGKGWIGSKGRTSPSHTHEIEPTYTE